MQYVSASVQDRVLFVVRSVLEQNSIKADVHPESRLVDIGLDSMDMVALMLKVEAEFDLTLPQPEITPENFQSVKTLELMILNQLGPGRRMKRLGERDCCRMGRSPLICIPPQVIDESSHGHQRRGSGRRGSAGPPPPKPG